MKLTLAFSLLITLFRYRLFLKRSMALLELSQTFAILNGTTWGWRSKTCFCFINSHDGTAEIVEKLVLLKVKKVIVVLHQRKSRRDNQSNGNAAISKISLVVDSFWRSLFWRFTRNMRKVVLATLLKRQSALRNARCHSGSAFENVFCLVYYLVV